MKRAKFIAPIVAVTASALMFAGCSLFESEEQKTFKAFVPSIVRQYDSIKWDIVADASSYDVYKNGEKIETVTSNVYEIGDEFSADNTYYIIAHSDELKRDTKQSNEVTYYKNTSFDEGESISITNSSNVTVSNTVRHLVINEYKGAVNLDIADRTADLIVSIKDSSLASGLDFTYDTSKNEHSYNVILEIEGNVSIKGKDGKSYTSADKGANNSEINGKSGGSGQTALKGGVITIKGNGNVNLTGGAGGNASEGSDSSGWTTKECGKGASGGNGGNGITCSTLYLKIGDGNKLTAVGGTAGKKSNPGVNGALISGPIVSAAWFNWDIGKDGTAGVAASIGSRVVLSGEIV